MDKKGNGPCCAKCRYVNGEGLKETASNEQYIGGWAGIIPAYSKNKLQNRARSGCIMGSIWRFIRPYKVPAGIAILFMLLELAVELVQPLLMAKIINEGVMEKDPGVVSLWGGIMMFLSVVAFFAGIMNTFYASHTSQSFSYDIRNSTFRHIQSLSYSQFSIFSTGSLLTRLTNDIQQLQNTVFMMLRIMLRAPLLIIGGLTMALIVDVRMGMFLAVTVPVLFSFLIYIFAKGSRMFRTVQEKLDQVNTVIGENLTGMKLIRAFQRRNYEEVRFSGANAALKEKTSSVLRFMEVTMPSLLLLMNITIIVILWYGHNEINTAKTDVGSVVAIINYATRITSSLSVFSFIVMAFSRARASAQRLDEVLQTEPSMTDPAMHAEKGEIRGEITFKNVSFTYDSQSVYALKNLSFTVAPGETLAVMGATGSGKSTLVNLIPRLYDSVEGTVAIDGTDVRDMKQTDLRMAIGVVPQTAMLFTGTIKENLLWGDRDATDEELEAACRAAQIYGLIERMPDRFATRVGQKGVNLSGGQRQRLSIARALMRKPAILLFDDSTSALDINTERRLLGALKNYKSTKIFITQKISTAKEANKILLLKDGEKIAEGTHEDLMKHSVLYNEILKSQNEEGRESHAIEPHH